MTEDTPYDRPLDEPPETQTSIGEWANATFGGTGDPLSPRHCIRLLEEVVELCMAAGASRDEIYRASIRELDKLAVINPGWYEPHPNIAKVPEEMADCEIVLRVLSHRRDVDLQSEVDKKMLINRSRKWKLNNDGTGYHVKEGEK